MPSNLTANLFRAIVAANVPIVSLSIGDPTNKATWTVQPANLQSAAQATIDAFDPNDPALARAEADAAVTADEDVTVLIPALLKHWPAMQAEITATGKLNENLWTERITSTTRIRQRARKGV